MDRAALGELIGLRWGDVELTQTPAVLSVWRSSYKGWMARQKAALGNVKCSSLSGWSRYFQQYRTQCFGTGMQSGWQEQSLFQTALGTKLDPDNTRQRHFLPLLKRANLPHARIHDLRDCFATLLGSVVHHRIFPYRARA